MIIHKNIIFLGHENYALRTSKDTTTHEEENLCEMNSVLTQEYGNVF